ncbi:hypothetical protein ACMZ29_16315 [Brevibacterium casei]|uniref:hypothetical protein n=1 Tax=Brevibacterium casei TaxID=33889 RepID=UPI0039F007A1
MNTDIVTHTSASALEMSVAEKQNYASILADANMIPKAFQRNPANVFVAIEYGNALGIQPIVALNEINVINGSPSLSASMMSSLARSAGHIVRTRNDDDGSAVCEIIRKDDPDFTHRSVWDQKKAQAAGLWGKGHWAKDPATMLRWRATSECVRMACPEVLGGLKYTPEEVAEFTSETPPPAPSPRPRTQKQREQANQTQQAPAQGSGRDWYAEAGDCETADQLAALFNQCKAAGELDDDLKSFLMTTGTALRQMEEQTTEVIDGQLVDENGVIQEQGA